jgi:hypothetical protein
MLFLQSVTKYAEKIKQSDEPKVYSLLCVHINFVLLKYFHIKNSSKTTNADLSWLLR